VETSPPSLNALSLSKAGSAITASKANKVKLVTLVKFVNLDNVAAEHKHVEQTGFVNIGAEVAHQQRAGWVLALRLSAHI
jgi:hypothetical protein